MSNTEQMVSVPRKWVENYADLLEERCAYEASERVQALLAQPAAQHQGEPVKTPARDESLGTAERDEYANGYRHGWNAYNDEIAKLGPLYTRPDAGEVERLREQVAKQACVFCNDSGNLMAENDKLRTQLAERDALVKWWKDHLSVHLAILFGTCGHSPEEADQSADDIISRAERLAPKASVSAEPNQCDGCQAGIPLVNGAHRMGKPVGYADTMSCQAGKYASAEPSAPVERAEFQREGRYIIIKLGDLAKVPAAVVEPFAEQLTAIQRRLPSRQYVVVESDWPEYEPTWAAIQARAALERKP